MTYSYVRRLQCCVRCRIERRFGIAWPEGFVCIQCIQRATKLSGPCPGCGEERLLVGRNGDGEPICVDCTGIHTCFRCERCGKEDLMWRTRTCVACAFEMTLTLLLGQSGVVPAELMPLYQRLTSMENTRSGMSWVNKEPVRQRLQALGRGEVPLTHEGIDQLPGRQGREHLRDLLVEVGVLPYRDKYLAAFKAWSEPYLAAISEPEIRLEIRLFIAWSQERDLVVRAEAGRLEASRTNRARDTISGALRFLRFLAARDKALVDLEQCDVDDWFAEASHPSIAHDYLVFAVAHRRCRRVRIPQSRRPFSAGTPLPRLTELVTRLVRDESIELADRVAGLLVLLFAQTMTRVAGLRVSAVVVADSEVTLNLGQHPVPLPGAVAPIFTTYLEQRVRMRTTNTETDYLFPGGRPGQHVTAFQLTKRLNALGITKAERQGALTHLVNEVPAAVVAKATGYSLGSTAARSVLFGPDWARYAALKSSASR
jgi:hypothetical protein